MSRPVVVFVLGGPGAGKGTQCERISKSFGFKHLSAGDLLREERQRPGSQYGEMIENYIKEGQIVPVEVTVALLENAMRAHKWEGGKFLIDGFPRNKNNFDGWCSLMDGKVDAKFCLFLDCPEEVMEKRLIKRGESSGRVDDNVESIRKRFRTFSNDTLPIIKAFEEMGKMKRVRADRDVEEIWTEIQRMFHETE